MIKKLTKEKWNILEVNGQNEEKIVQSMGQNPKV